MQPLLTLGAYDRNRLESRELRRADLAAGLRPLVAFLAAFDGAAIPLSDSFGPMASQTRQRTQRSGWGSICLLGRTVHDEYATEAARPTSLSRTPGI